VSYILVYDEYFFNQHALLYGSGPIEQLGGFEMVAFQLNFMPNVSRRSFLSSVVGIDVEVEDTIWVTSNISTYVWGCDLGYVSIFCEIFGGTQSQIYCDNLVTSSESLLPPFKVVQSGRL